MRTIETLRNASRAAKHKLLLRTRVVHFLRKARKERGGARLLYEAMIDYQYGGWCGGLVHNPDAPDASRVQSSRYSTLKMLFSPTQVAVQPTDVLVDVGCGKGRAINFWLHQGYQNRMFGIDLNEPVAQRTAQRLKGFSNVRIVAGDVLDLLPPDGTLFYMYNPFGVETMRTFARRLIEVCATPADVRIVYLNALHKNVFCDDLGWTVRLLKSDGPEEAVVAFPHAASA